MTNQTNQGCILCGEDPKGGLYISGQRMIKGKSYLYQLCKSCCLRNQDYSDVGLSRKKLWSKVDEKLLSERH